MNISDREEEVYKSTRKKEYVFSVGHSNKIRDLILSFAHVPLKSQMKEENASK